MTVTNKQSVRWFDMPHLPHGWDRGFLRNDPGESRPTVTIHIYSGMGVHYNAIKYSKSD